MEETAQERTENERTATKNYDMTHKLSFELPLASVKTQCRTQEEEVQVISRMYCILEENCNRWRAYTTTYNPSYRTYLVLFWTLESPLDPSARALHATILERSQRSQGSVLFSLSNSLTQRAPGAYHVSCTVLPLSV